MRLSSLLVPLAIFWSCSATHARPPAPAKALHQDPRQPTAARVDALLAQMTLDEKLILLSGKGFEARPIPRLGIPELAMTDGPNGVRWGKTATAFPVGIAAASAFDPQLVGEMGKVLAKEARARGRAVLLAPCVNISRVPQNGRNFECFGEDPFLSARTAVGYIKGVQSEGVIATVKHFACNNQEHRRREIDVRVSKRTLHEIYFPAFEASVKEAGVYTVMAAYNKVNGLYSTENPYLLDEVLKKRWGFRGFVMSDWDAVQHTLPPVQAGLDMEMPEGTYTGEAKLKPLVTSGQVDQKVIDDKIRRILWVMFESGNFDKPPKETAGVVGAAAHKQVALDMARASIVLVKNDNAVLPLTAAKVKSVAVIGPGAIYPRVGGGGSGEVRPDTASRPLDELRALLGGDVKVEHAAGISMEGDVQPIAAEAFSHKEGDAMKPGLVAEYFNNKEVEGQPVHRDVVRDIDFDWGNDAPAAKVNADFFSVRYTGLITPKEAGRYRFLGAANNGFRVFIEGKLFLNAWAGEEFKKPTAEIDLEARPYDIRIEFFESKGQAKILLGWGRTEASLKDAVALAKRSDAAVVFAGFSAFYETESTDHGLELPKNQIELIKAVARANKRTVVVLNSGSPLLMENWVNAVPALVEAWYPGQEGARATAEILTGAFNPSARLPFTFLKDWKHSPAFKTYPEVGDTAPYTEGVFVGYRHYDAKKLPVRFPFGHGLSYTKFEYAKLQIQPAAAGGDAQEPGWDVSFEIANRGSSEGAEVAQVYLGQAKSPVPRPPKVLRGFSKVKLAPGETKTVTVRLGARDLAYFDEGKDDWVTPDGTYQVYVGASSRDIRLSGTFLHKAR